MVLMHNQAVRISSSEVQGLYRVIVNEISQNLVYMVRLDKPADSETRGRSANANSTKRKRKSPMPLCGEIVPFDGTVVKQMIDLGMITNIEVERENFDDSQADVPLFERRKTVMADFLSFDLLRSAVIVNGSIASLVKETEQKHGAGPSMIRRCWSLLCRYGFSLDSLRPRRDRCGAPGVTRDCIAGKREKAGRKTLLEQICNLTNEVITNPQPGMNADWRSRIMVADNKIPSPKPKFPARFKEIIALGFTNKYTDENGKLKEVPLKLGEYPNPKQVRRVLDVEIPRLKQVLQKTTQGHFDLHSRGLTGRSWEDVEGPGHTWGMDSTIGDIYLRSSINRHWIIGRPIVYMMVDIWSTAIVGFYVCLRGPSWEMAKVALFNAAASPDLVGQLRGFEQVCTLNPHPTLPAVILGDNGEYKSLAAKETAYEYLERLSLTPPYRPDLKGMVEVLHRITKDHQFWVQGAIDARRKEYELRKFDPNKAVYTISEYVEHLHNIVCEYNLTSDRSNRLDTEMIADGVVPTPAGLWRWGHAVGIGRTRYHNDAHLIDDLLPTSTLDINRDGLQFGKIDYQSDAIVEAKWTSHARNFGSWKVPCYYYPGSMSRIWTKDTIKGSGLLELSLSDHAKTAPTNTYEEVLDAITYGALNKREVAHDHLNTGVKFYHSNQTLHEGAKAKTAAATAEPDRVQPTPSQARTMEAQLGQAESAPIQIPSSPTSQPSFDHDEDDEDASHMELLQSVLDKFTGKVGNNE